MLFIKKKKIHFTSLLITPLIAFNLFPLTSCSVSKTFIKVNKKDPSNYSPGSKIEAYCDFWGLNPDDFSWRIEPGDFFEWKYIDLQNSKTTVIKNTKYVEIPLSSEIPQQSFSYFSLKIVFFSTSDSSIVKKTQPIRVYKNLYSPIIEEKFQVSLNEKPQLEDKYFIDNSSKNTLSAIDFLDIGLPNESTHLYDEEKYREIRQILQSDLVCYFLYTLSSLKVTDLSFALKVPFWLTINIDKIEQSDFEYTYDMSTKAFINLSVKLNISGKALGMFPFSVILNFEMKNYKIIGAFTRDSSYKTILNDRKRILLGNFLSLVPIDEDSYYHLDFKANFANLINYNIKYYYFLNGDGNLGTASDMWATGENAGFWIPCYNLNGKEFTEKVLDINSYSEEKQADEISNLLKTKNIEPIIVPTDFKEKFKFYLKKDFLNKFKEFKKDENAFCFENLAQKVIFINMMSCENNKDWKTLQINLEEPSIVLSLPYYQFLSRLNFNLINENKLNVKIIFNKCFKFNNDYDSFTINLVNDNNLFIVD